MPQLPKLLIIMGLGIAALGVLLLVGQKLGLGRLPGDLTWEGKHGSVHFPIVTSLLISVVLTIVLNLWLGRSR